MNPPPQSLVTRDEPLLSHGESVVYKQVEGGPDLQAHLFFPPSGRRGAGRTAIVFFFGSGWDRGRVVQFAPQALHFARRGAIAVLADYRTSSSHGAGPLEAMQDARSAIRWVRFYAEPLGVHSDRIVAAGALAGGTLAAATAMKSDLPDEGADPEGVSGVPNAVALFSPVVEVAKDGYGAPAFAESGTPLSAASLFPHIARGLPPFLILHGTDDRFAPYAKALDFSRRMQRKGNVCDLIPFEGRPHSFFSLNVDPVAHDHCNALVDRFLVHLGFLGEARPDEEDGEGIRLLP